MALTIEVTKVSVADKGNKIYLIFFNLRCQDNGTEVINKNFDMNYQRGDDVEQSVRDVLIKMQKEIDEYKAEDQIFTAAKLDTAVTWVQSNLVG